MQPLTKVQSRVLKALMILLEGADTAPSQDELAQAVGLTDSTIRTHLSKLEGAGYIQRKHGQQRTIELTSLHERLLFSVERADALFVGGCPVIARKGLECTFCDSDGNVSSINSIDVSSISVSGTSWICSFLGSLREIVITPTYSQEQGSFE